MAQQVIVSPSPHIHSGDTISKNMYGVLIALIPAFLVMLYQFRTDALLITAISVASCMLTEWVITRFFLHRPCSLLDGSALLTGVILAFNLPASLPWWLVLMGGVVAIGIGKMAFGGLGNNIFNPALVGRVFLLISYPAQMTTWKLPARLAEQAPDAVSGATPLGILKSGAIDQLPDSLQLLVGFNFSSMGEVSAIAILIGLAYLLIRRIITWHTPVAIIVSAFVLSGIMHLYDPAMYASPFFHLLTGGLLFGAVFMATDYVTSPISHRAQLIYGCMIGLLTVIIRLWGSYPEGMSFAILIMNAFTPLLNNYIKPRHFGHVGKSRKEAKR